MICAPAPLPPIGGLARDRDSHLEAPMAESNAPHREERASPTPASAPDELVKDLEVQVSDGDQDAVKAGHRHYKFYDLLISG
jgi:hypothetical protein